MQVLNLGFRLWVSQELMQSSLGILFMVVMQSHSPSLSRIWIRIPLTSYRRVTLYRCLMIKQVCIKISTALLRLMIYLAVTASFALFARRCTDVGQNSQIWISIDQCCVNAFCSTNTLSQTRCRPMAQLQVLDKSA